MLELVFDICAAVVALYAGFLMFKMLFTRF